MDVTLGKWYGAPPGWTWLLYESNLMHKTTSGLEYHNRETYVTQRCHRYSTAGQRCQIPEGVLMTPTTVNHKEGSLCAEGTTGYITHDYPCILTSTAGLS